MTNNRVQVLFGGRRSGKRFRQQIVELSMHSVQLDEIPPSCYPADLRDAMAYMIASMINPIPLPIADQVSGYDIAAGVDRTVWIVHCKHGARLYGRECIQCSREGEQ
jgi:hypothetical protein